MEDASELSILERIRVAAGGLPDQELAKTLELSRQSITKAKATKSVPASWIPKASLLFNVTTDWLFFGREPMHTRPPETTPQAACERCTKLEGKLEATEAERRELAAETRQLHRDKELLLREIGELREKVARLEERKRRYELTHGLSVEDRDVG